MKMMTNMGDRLSHTMLRQFKGRARNSDNALKLLHFLIKVGVLGNLLPERRVEMIKNDLICPIHLPDALVPHFAAKKYRGFVSIVHGALPSALRYCSRITYRTEGASGLEWWLRLLSLKYIMSSMLRHSSLRRRTRLASCHIDGKEEPKFGDDIHTAVRGCRMQTRDNSETRLPCDR
jgi:hypothetical protein